jgi:hypothetical protein
MSPALQAAVSGAAVRDGEPGEKKVAAQVPGPAGRGKRRGSERRRARGKNGGSFLNCATVCGSF